MHYLSFSKWVHTLLIALLVAVSPNYAFAEDIEIFSGELPPSKPNIMFLLDQSGSMNTEMGNSGDTRLTALQGAFNAVVSDPEVAGLNVGLMSFSNNGTSPFPHGVSFPVSYIDDDALPIMESNYLPAALTSPLVRGYFDLSGDTLPDPTAGQTVRQYLPKILDGWTAFGATPIVDAYYEAALYFRGEVPLWGSASAEYNHAAHPSTYDGTILSQIATAPTGNTRTCYTPDCGINCALTTPGSVYCPTGETSCYLGTNCQAFTNPTSYYCSLGTEAECMDSDQNYTSCSTTSSESCTETCNGEKHPESGACLGTTTSSCTPSSYIYCQGPEVTKYACEKERYQCDEVSETITTVANATYKSPIINECQNNAIIILSDGQPFVDNVTETDNTRALVKTMTGSAGNCADVLGQVLPVTDFNSLADGRCGTELADYLNTQDQSAGVDGENTIQTYTVGFGVDDASDAEVFLRSLAVSGGGKYFPARDRAALVAAFKSIIDDIDVSARSFAAPVYTVDPNSMLSHSDDIFLPLFQNSSSPAWSGNIKKFKLNAAGKIIDANGAEAIDGMGVLKPDAVDFWANNSASRVRQTNPVTGGGLANNLNLTPRKLRTDNGAGLVALDDDNVTKADLGDAAMTDADKAKLLNYIQGLESDGTTPRLGIGDILHSKPTVISYTGRQVLYFGTNEGYLHAVDASDTGSLGARGAGGTEIFAYMPKSLLKNIEGIVTNEELTGPLKRIYGVDGPMTAWIIDNNKDGKVDIGAGDEAYLFFGLRRGGSEYYALNVTNPERPSLAWKIENTGATGDFSKLGESWSKPVLSKLRYKQSGAVKFDDVLIFGGGYDNKVDDEVLASTGAPISGAKGNDVYIVNAKTGDLIWSASSTGNSLQHSVPGDIRVLDLDRNGSIDRLYFGDTGGNIWRADLNVDDVDTDASLHDVKNDARVSKFASLGGGGSNARKFFYEPDVSLFRHNGTNTIVVSTGSGYRSHPLNDTINDRFYVLYDENVFGIPTTAPAALVEGDLIESNTLAGRDFLPAHKGWYKKLVNGQGEKVLASPIMFNNKVIFTTFAKTATTVTTGIGACTTLTNNQTRAYVLDLMTASATVDLDDDGSVDSSDDSIIISHGDILDSPQLVFNELSDCTSEGCDQHVDIRVGKNLVPIVDKNTKNGNANLGDFLPKVFWVSE
jgi:hypothetical protein